MPFISVHISTQKPHLACADIQAFAGAMLRFVTCFGYRVAASRQVLPI